MDATALTALTAAFTETGGGGGGGGGEGPKCPYNRTGSSERRNTSSFDDPTDSQKGGSGDDRNCANFTTTGTAATIEEEEGGGEEEADTVVMVTRERGGAGYVLQYNQYNRVALPAAQRKTLRCPKCAVWPSTGAKNLCAVAASPAAQPDHLIIALYHNVRFKNTTFGCRHSGNIIILCARHGEEGRQS